MAKGVVQFTIRFMKEVNTDEYVDDDDVTSLGIKTLEDAVEFERQALAHGEINIEEFIDEAEIGVTVAIISRDRT